MAWCIIMVKEILKRQIEKLINFAYGIKKYTIAKAKDNQIVLSSPKTSIVWIINLK